MLTYERQIQILEILKAEKCVSADYLSKKLFVSGATIRRDLGEMEKKDLLTRIHGGAALIEGSNEDAPLLLRTKKELARKKQIAKLAINLIGNAKIIFMDSSSTVSELAALFNRFTNLSIITSGIAEANILNERSTNEVYVCGGLIINNSSMTGQAALDMVSNINADICFFHAAA